jgi:hypothetical protein
MQAMETQQLSTAAKAERPAPTHYHSKSDLAARYRVTTRTIDRWRMDGLFPQPDLVLPGGKCRWSDDTVVAHERASVSKRG